MSSPDPRADRNDHDRRAPGHRQAGRPVDLAAALDWFLRDPRTGRVVVAQLPNAPILLFVASVIGRWFVEDGSTLDVLLAWAGTITLGWWAIDEIARGLSPFRRVLGVLGVAVVVVGVLGRL